MFYIIIFSQLLFSASDLLARYFMRGQGFLVATFLQPWFIAYTVMRIFATFGQLYIISSVEVGKTMALFGAVSIIIVNVLGFLLLKEALTPTTYIGISLAVMAFLVLAFK